MDSTRNRWRIGAAVAVAAAVSYALPIGDVRALPLFLLEIAGIVHCRRAARRATAASTGWRLIAAGLSVSLAGDLLGGAYYAASGMLPPTPGPGDALYVLSVVLLMSGVVNLVPRHASSRGVSAGVDAAKFAIGAGTVLFLLVLDGPGTEDGGLVARTVGLSYVLSAVGAVFVLARRLVATRSGNTSELMLLAGLVGLCASDIFYASRIVRGGYHLGGLTDLGFVACYLMVFLAASHASARSVGELSEEVERAPTTPMVGFYVGLWCIQAACLVESFRRHDPDAFAVVIAGLAISYVLGHIQLLSTAHQVQRRLDQLGMLVAHELRSPVTAITGTLTLLEHDLPPSDRVELLAIASRQARRIADLSDDLTVLARIDEAGTGARAVPVAEAVRTALLAVPGSAHQISLDIADDVCVTSSPEALHQAIRTLLSDAVRRTGDGRVHVSAVTNEGVVRLSVRDGDCSKGLPMVDPGAARGESVTGLDIGMTVAARLVHGMGGRMQVERADGSGCLTTVVLPATRPDHSRRVGTGRVTRGIAVTAARAPSEPLGPRVHRRSGVGTLLRRPRERGYAPSGPAVRRGSPTERVTTRL